MYVLDVALHLGYRIIASLFMVEGGGAAVVDPKRSKHQYTAYMAPIATWYGKPFEAEVAPYTFLDSSEIRDPSLHPQQLALIHPIEHLERQLSKGLCEGIWYILGPPRDHHIMTLGPMQELWYLDPLGSQ